MTSRLVEPTFRSQAHAKPRLLAIAFSGSLALLGFLSGCGTSKKDQLEQVAKDWCMTIRASQIIPVYPLTEDLQPGDIFLVQVPVDRQQELYDRKGFLPLDNHLDRLDPTGYPGFYDHSFIRSDQSVRLPLDWMRPSGTTAQAWTTAPNAAFPTYSFSVTRAGGLNLAIPISGVPVGLSLMGTDTANGSVSIKESRTLGVDVISLYKQLQVWADDNRSFVSNFSSPPGKPSRNYLRVITRIYTTGELEVQLNNARTISAGADVGAARPVDLFVPTSPDSDISARDAARENYDRGLAHINSMARSRGTPMYTSGDDVGLTPEELRARAEARAAELDSQKEAARKNVADKQKAADKARADGKSPAETLRAAQRELAKSQQAASEARQAREDARASQKSLAPDAPKKDKDAAAKAVADADTAVAKADADVQTKQKAVQAARTQYQPSADAIAKADVELASSNAVLERLQGFAPGGSFRFNAASARSVSMTESFDPPLTLGYLAFDAAILPGGRLGRPIPTHAVVNAEYAVPSERAAIVQRELTDPLILTAMYRAIAKDTDPAAQRIVSHLNSLSGYIPLTIGDITDGTEPGSYSTQLVQLMRGNFLDYVAYMTKRDRGFEKLTALKKNRSLQVKDPAGKWQPASASDYKDLDKLIARYQTRSAERQDFESARRALLEYYSATFDGGME